MSELDRVIIRFGGRLVECHKGENLRKVLLTRGLSPYYGSSHLLNCRGLGSCGTCALEVRGEVSPPTFMEKWRLRFPPHRWKNKLRLACQCRVLGNLEIIKHPGFWGHRVSGEE